jgi:hypothetical protein
LAKVGECPFEKECVGECVSFADRPSRMGSSVLLRLRLNFDEDDLRPFSLPSSEWLEETSSSSSERSFFRFLSGDRAAVDSIEAASVMLRAEEVGNGDEEGGWLLASSTGETLETQQLDGGFREYDKEVEFAVYLRYKGEPRGVVGS